MKEPNFLKRVRYYTGINEAILFSIIGRLTQGLCGIIVLILIAKFLDEKEQGFYFTFGSLVALQIFFELGINTILIQFTAREKASLQIDGASLVGPQYNLSRLASLMLLGIRYFVLGGTVLFCFFMVGGNIYFSASSESNYIDWSGPWLLLSLATVLSMILNAFYAFLEGFGFVAFVARVRFFQYLIYWSGLFIALYCGLKLMSLGLALMSSGIFLFIVLLCSEKGRLLRSLFYVKIDHRIIYREEVFPLQWRLALSWISGYLLFQIITPIILITQGAKIAGQFGMTLAICNGLSSISMSWINTKIPWFTSLITQKKFTELDSGFLKAQRETILVYVLGAAMVFILFIFNSRLAERLLNSTSVLLFLSAFLVNQLIFSWAAFIRAHNKEPFTLVSIISAFFNVMAIFYISRFYNTPLLIALSFTSVIVLITLPWSFHLYKIKKREYRE